MPTIKGCDAFFCLMGKHLTKTFRNFKNFDANAFKKDLSELPWSIIEIFVDPNDAWLTFKDLFMKTADSHAPYIQRRIKSQSEPWINEEVLQLIHEKEKLIRELSLNDNAENDPIKWERYREVRNTLTATTRRVKKEYFDSVIEENKFNPKGLWRQTEILTPRKTEKYSL